MDNFGINYGRLHIVFKVKQKIKYWRAPLIYICKSFYFLLDTLDIHFPISNLKLRNRKGWKDEKRDESMKFDSDSPMLYMTDHVK